MNQGNRKRTKILQYFWFLEHYYKKQKSSLSYPKLKFLLKVLKLCSSLEINDNQSKDNPGKYLKIDLSVNLIEALVLGVLLPFGLSQLNLLQKGSIVFHHIYD